MTRPKLGKPLPGEKVLKRRCQARTRDGRPCGATPMVHPRKVNGKLKYVCLFHYQDFATQMGRRGQHGKQRGPECITQFDPPTTPADLIPILSSTIAEIRAGSVDEKTVRALVSTSGAFLETLKIADIDKRMKVLEKKQLQQRGGSIRPNDFAASVRDEDD